MIGSRLKQERERLGYTQPAFAEFAGAKRRTLIDWEKGVSSPTAVQLSGLARAGADVLYILTGDRRLASTVQEPTPWLLNDRQAALLGHYRKLSEADKQALERIAAALAQLAKVNAADGGSGVD
ncbi:helix-turn-helix domain-containing protein [Corticibacter populi]|uniref:Helix-turn-helix domain-containing protein n=1 Tax=Corticibacter populi TaxID=1550736 RepID=A0A3M6R0G7_9BURK|nr:helix-turn-helix domain-containing protein [Corticibacter populi]RMX08379.1 helix-turn-helix domain-containing protein [Corticibacter populi]RZS35680.1 helix-turn-helix protein [Corticibacter populi]